MTSEGGLVARAGRCFMMSIIGTEDRTEPVSDRETRHLLSSHHRVTSVTTQTEAALALLNKKRLKMTIKRCLVWPQRHGGFPVVQTDMMSGISI